MFRRLYHISCVSYSFKKQALKLNKLLNPRSKRQWYPSDVLVSQAMPTIKGLAKTKREPGKQGIKRLAMLNKLFMKQITDLMSTGTVGMQIVGRGIEISKVQVTPDFQTVHVFWVCKGDARDEETDTVLNKIAGALRHELSTLRVMGEVPYIVFVKDKYEAQLVDLDRRLAEADYGEDYTPCDMGSVLKTEFTLNTKLSPDIKAKIKQLEDETELIEEPIPEMTHTVFGLDHAKIMSRLVAARKKTKDAWSNIGTGSNVISYRTPDERTMDNEVGNQRQELAEFLLKRQILQNKLHKQMLARDVAQVTMDDAQEEDDTYEYYTDDEELYDDDYFYDGLQRDKKDGTKLD